MRKKILIIDDKHSNAVIWRRLAIEAGLEDLVDLIQPTSELILKEFRESYSKDYFEGTILDYSFQRRTNAGHFLSALSDQERLRLGRIVLATSNGAVGCHEVAKNFCGNRLIESMVRGDRLSKLKEFFGSSLSIEERIALLEQAVNSLSDRIRNLERGTST